MVGRYLGTCYSVTPGTFSNTCPATAEPTGEAERQLFPIHIKSQYLLCLSGLWARGECLDSNRRHPEAWHAEYGRVLYTQVPGIAVPVSCLHDLSLWLSPVSSLERFLGPQAPIHR